MEAFAFPEASSLGHHPTHVISQVFPIAPDRVRVPAKIGAVRVLREEEDGKPGSAQRTRARSDSRVVEVLHKIES